MGSIKTISIIVAANIKGLESGMGKANKSLAKFASNAVRVGSMMSFGVTAPLVALGKSAFDTFAKFENGMMKVKAVTGASVGEFKMLTDEAKRLGSTTRFTALQVADLQLVLGRKGFDPTAIKNMEKSILDLALATGEDLSLAAEVTAASINSFGLESSQAARVANTLASAAANSSIQLSTFSTAFGHAGASANAVGIDLEELAAMMGVLMDNGIKASKAGTGLRKIFMKLHKEGRDFTEVLDLATQGELGLEKAMKLAGVTSAGQLLILAKNKKKVAELTEEYKTNTGRLDEMTALMGGTAEDKVLRMQSAIEGMKIEIGALLADAILPIIRYITEWTTRFKDLNEETKKTILKVAGIAAAIGPVLMILALLATAISAVTSGFKGLWGAIVLVGKGLKGLALAISTNPIGALAVIVSTLAGYWLLTAKNNKTANAELDATAIKAKKAADRLKEINEQLELQGKSQNDLLKIEALDNQNRIWLELANLTHLATERKAELNQEYNKWGDVLNRIKSDEANQLISVNSLKNGYDELGEAIPTDLPDLSSSYSSMTGINFDVGNGSSSGGEEETTLPFTDLEKQLSEASEGVTEFFDKWGDSINMVGDIFGKMMQNQMVDLENSHKKKADAIANSNMNEEDKATAMLNLDKETAKEKAKILRKQAIAEKAAAVVSAVMNGALAISKTLGQAGFLGIPLSAIVGALAATQVATIAASPIPAFAKGGLVTGATMGLVGEGRGTSMSNPEVIAPLDKLKSMLGDSGGSGTVIPDVRITGDDLLIVFDRANRRKERR
jgi:hypothetical protein